MNKNVVCLVDHIFDDNNFQPQNSILFATIDSDR